uniref:Uncharacterized protein n=1 Tax=viral metagenome TaxID=1070528 RepID=A0A6M3JL85_9ZZZZ
MMKVLEWLGKILIPILVLSLIAWATWITTSIYAGDKGEAIVSGKVEALSERIGRLEGEVKEVKEGQKTIQKDMKASDEKAHRNQIEMLKVLSDIKRNTQ